MSQNFFDFDGDGYQRKSAWASNGTGVLVFDADGDGKISRSSEFAFTEWADGTDSDLEALRRVFDTNNNNKLDAGDSRWADFKIWLNGTLVSLGSQNIASIDLIATGSGQAFEDGSALTGTAKFTKTDGTTGTVADAVLASETDSHIVKTATVTNGDGSVTSTISGFDKDGSLAFRNVVTTSADGLSVRTQFDDDGDGTFDRSQTDVRSQTSGIQKRVVSNFNADGSLKDATTTTTSADRNTVTTEVDQDGDGKRDQSQIYQKNSDGSSSTTVTQFSVSGKVLKRVLTTSSVDGLTKTVQTDSDGDGTYERARSEKTVVGSDGSRTITTEERGGSGAVISRELTTTDATGQTTTVKTDGDGNGVTERQATSKIETDAAGVIKTTTDTRNSTGVLLEQVITTKSRDGLVKTVQQDVDGDGAIDRVGADTTVNNAGALTQTVTEKSRSGALLSSEVTITSADRKTITVDTDADGNGKLDNRTSIVIDANGVTTSTQTQLTDNGGSILRTTAVTSADGLTVTTRTGRTGNTGQDKIVTDVTTAASDGSRTRTVTTTMPNGVVIAKTAVTTTADGLTETTRQDIDANGTFDLISVDATKLNTDASRTNTVTVTSANGTLQSKTETITSTDRKTVTVNSDFDGDTKLDETRVTSIAADGTRKDTVTRLAANGQAVSKSETTSFAGGLRTLVLDDLDGNGTNDRSTDTVIKLNADGSRTTTVSQSTTASTPKLIGKTVTDVSGSGLKTVVQTDGDGDGVFETKSTQQTALNDDGSTTQTRSLANSTGALLGQTVTQTSASQLIVTTQQDQDGNGVFERTVKDVTTLAADGSQTQVVETKSSSGALIARETTVTKSNGHDLTVSLDADGNGFADETTSFSINVDGWKSSDKRTFDAAGKLVSRSTEMVTANGFNRTQNVDADGDGTMDRSVSQETRLGADGSQTQISSELGANNVLLSKTTVEINATGLTRKTTWADGSGATKRSSTETTTLQADGGRVETVVVSKADGSLESKTIKTTAAHGTTTTMTQDVDGDGVVDRKIVTAKLADGSVSQTSTDYSGTTVKDVKTVTTSANGLSQTTDYDTDGNGSIDRRVTAATVLNADGTRSTTTSTLIGTTLKDKTVTDTSANGLVVSTKWDTSGSGTFNKSQTQVTTLNADGSKTQTVSNLTGTTLTSRYATTTSGNGLSVTKQWDPTGAGSFSQTQTDVTLPNANGTSTRTVISKKADGSVLSKIVATTSADGKTLTSLIEEAGRVPRTVTTSTQILADGAVRETMTCRATSTNVLAEKTVTLTSADKRTVTIERDVNGDGILDQREESVKALSGEETSVVTDFISGITVKSRTTTLRSADGRRTTTTFDRDGNGAIDRTLIVDEMVNADGSRVLTTMDTDVTSGKPASKTVTKISAEGLSKVTSRDIDGDGATDQTEELRVTEPNGSTYNKVTNSTLAARDKNTLSASAVQWKETAADKIETTSSADGLSKVITFTYVGYTISTIDKTAPGGTNPANPVTVTVPSSIVTMRQSLQIDGSTITDVRETDTAGKVIATGQVTTSVDGRRTILTKDVDNNGSIDHREISATFLDGSVSLTKADLNADGSTSKSVTDSINSSGGLVSRIARDASDRKTSEIIMAADGSSVATTFDAPSGQITNVSNYSKDGIVTKSIYYDPLNKAEWARVEQQYDGTGQLLNEKYFNDDATRAEVTYDVNFANVWKNVIDYFDSSNRRTTHVLKNRDGTMGKVIYDVIGDKIYSRVEQVFTDDKETKQKYEIQFMKDNTKIIRTWDFNSQNNWEYYDDFHDTAGRVTTHTVKNRDGTTGTTRYDVTGKENWYKVEELSRGTSQIYKISYDRPNTKSKINWDVNGSNVWDYNIEYYDSADRIVKLILHNRDSTTGVVIYDVTGNLAYSRIEQVLDSNNNVKYQINVNRNGTRNIVTFDFDNTKDWIRAEEVRDSSNRTTVYNVYYDNLSRTLDQWDLDNTDSGWKRIQEIWTPPAAGQEAVLQKRSEWYDEGASARITEYELPNTKNYTEKLYATSGALSKQYNYKDGNLKTIETYDLINMYNWRLEIADNIDLSKYDYNKGETVHVKKVYYDDGSMEDFSYGYQTTNTKGSKQFGYIISNYGPDGNLRNVHWPVLLDMNGDGNVDLRPSNLVAGQEGSGAIFFDWNGDGTADLTAWVGPSDGFLAIDLGSDGQAGPDGKIDRAEELAFANWVNGEGDGTASPQISDLDGLRLVFDTNHDNILSDLDDRWSEFRVWQDLNQNGISDVGELQSLSEAGITLINLLPSTDGARTFSDGSKITGTSYFQTTDGKQHLAADAGLAWAQVTIQNSVSPTP